MPPEQFEQTQPGVLIVKISAHDPVPLSLMAELLSALAQDYRLVTGGRDLAIESVHEGTLTALLRDLADWADQANHLFDFANHIAGVVTAAIAGAILLRGRRRQQGSRTVLAIAEIAIKEKTMVRIVHKGRRGDTLAIDVNPDDGEAISRVATAPAEPPTRAPPLDLRLDALERAAIQATESKDVDGLSVLLRELIGIIRQRPEGQRQIDGLIHRLRIRGLDKAADLIEGL